MRNHQLKQLRIIVNIVVVAMIRKVGRIAQMRIVSCGSLG